VRTDKVAPREICPQVFGPSEKEPLSLRHDKVQDVTRWMAGSNERNAPILLSKSADCQPCEFVGTYQQNRSFSYRPPKNAPTE
jgi:hypothetical protein